MPLTPFRSTQRTDWWLWLGAAVVLCLGVALRFVYYDNPHGHSDENITVQVVGHMRQSGDWDDNWVKADLPPDMKYNQYNFSTHLYATYFFYRLTKLLPGTESWRGRENGFAVYRFLVALCAAVSVVQTFLLARRVAGLAAAVIATLLTGVSVLLVQDAHYVRPEPLTTVLMLAVAGLSFPGEEVRVGRLLAAGFMLGLLTACKVSMLLVGWVPFVPLLARWRDWRRTWWVAVLVLAAIAAGFVSGVPAAITRPAAFLNGVRALMTQYGGVHPPHSHWGGAPVADMLGRYFLATFGVPVVLALAVGIWVLARRGRWAEWLVVVGPVLAFAGYFATKSVFFERNLSHILPLAFIAAGVGAVAAVRWISARIRVPRAAIAIPLVLLLAWVPARLTAALMTVEYSGAGAERLDAFENVLKSRHPGIVEWSEMLLTDEPLGRLEANFRSHPEPVLLRVTDYADDNTRINRAQLLRRFDATLVAEYPGTFPGMPTCTLLTYHSPHYQYFLVRGPKR